jgi:hypothetical protein
MFVGILIIVVYKGANIYGMYRYTSPMIVQILPKVEFENPLIASKNVLSPTSLTKKLVHIGAVAIKISTAL